MKTKFPNSTPLAKSSNKDAWLTERRKLITATDTSCILGINPFRTSFDVFTDKLWGSKPIKSPHIDRGILAEPLIIQHAQTVLDASIRETKDLEVSKDYTWLGCTPDAYNEDTLFEIKCPSKIWKSPPKYYVAQVMQQMIVTGFTKAFLIAAQYPEIEETFVVFPIEFDKELAYNIITETKKFSEFIQERTLPLEYWK